MIGALFFPALDQVTQDFAPNPVHFPGFDPKTQGVAEDDADGQCQQVSGAVAQIRVFAGYHCTTSGWSARMCWCGMSGSSSIGTNFPSLTQPSYTQRIFASPSAAQSSQIVATAPSCFKPH